VPRAEIGRFSACATHDDLLGHVLAIRMLTFPNLRRRVGLMLAREDQGVPRSGVPPDNFETLSVQSNLVLRNRLRDPFQEAIPFIHFFARFQQVLQAVRI
jgi:hypothetical protein